MWDSIMSFFRGGPPLPHPKERQDKSRTVANTNAVAIVCDWLIAWHVPSLYWRDWLNYNVIITDQLSVPADTDAQNNRMRLRPDWASPGVVAHEFAHESYSWLSDADKAAFKTEYNKYLVTDKYLVSLHKENRYMDTNIIEAHAEVYRFIGEKMPEAMKRFYPKLLV